MRLGTLNEGTGLLQKEKLPDGKYLTIHSIE